MRALGGEYPDFAGESLTETTRPESNGATLSAAPNRSLLPLW